MMFLLKSIGLRLKLMKKLHQLRKTAMRSKSPNKNFLYKKNQLKAIHLKKQKQTLITSVMMTVYILVHVVYGLISDVTLSKKSGNDNHAIFWGYNLKLFSTVVVIKEGLITHPDCTYIGHLKE